jgi:hypothetical protein
MRKTILLSAILLTLAAPLAIAQTSTPNAPPAPAGQTPPEKTAAPMKSGGHTMRQTDRTTNTTNTADIRPGHEPGVGDSFPASNKASNITAADTRSPIAPRLPAPGVGEATPAAYLGAAQSALNAHQTGRAQEALERAETAMLQRSVPADMAATPDQQPGVVQVKLARDALAKGDVRGARQAISAAMTAS